MQKSGSTEETCPIGLSLDVLGQKWTLLIVRESMRGRERFSEFHAALGCPKNLLAARLRLLCDCGVLRTEEHHVPGERTRHRYVLTDAGRELAPTLVALYDWGKRHQATAEMTLVDPPLCWCGAERHVIVRCQNGHLDDNESMSLLASQSVSSIG
ncbi:winged helix-turn-helix transcriptional regulator [Microbacterium rhizomatis]|uniref:Helix-turn-helix transcriptional regulator n=1 Tax=Microbacterium rhizomatis TaxID=1631477 RepID=A0A5J5IY01_9MICO|nr:helix-turn-helix domain-containing protein [Microbacterium rhizomatis]KAA9104758.1 helix-turn-helix transcriptional regulator [Microbacterium rhizomatis]